MLLYSTDCYTGNGADYIGKVDHASDGNQCQQWDWGDHSDLIYYNDDGDFVSAYYDAWYYIFDEHIYDDDDSTTETINFCR